MFKFTKDKIKKLQEIRKLSLLPGNGTTSNWPKCLNEEQLKLHLEFKDYWKMIELVSGKNIKSYELLQRLEKCFDNEELEMNAMEYRKILDKLFFNN